MKTVSIVEARDDLEAMLNRSQQERVVITRGGRPCALVVGIESYDAEDVALASSPEFWRMIQDRRRKGKSIPLAQVEARLNAETHDRPRPPRKARGQAASKSASKSGTRRRRTGPFSKKGPSSAAP